MLFFFFSSRRRHTRLQGDWSSDVCSSDLPAFAERDRPGPARGLGKGAARSIVAILAAIGGGGRCAPGKRHRSEERRVGKECGSGWEVRGWPGDDMLARAGDGTSVRAVTAAGPSTCSSRSCCSFFFQAEDGIRDYKVTGVQTCALPICQRLQSATALALLVGWGKVLPGQSLLSWLPSAVGEGALLESDIDRKSVV